MAVYAIGDLQGCYDPFQRLLERIAFDPTTDRLWLVGDLVNRGPDNLGCLRTVRDLGDAAITVLGNHDLNLLAVAAGHRRLRAKDTLQDVLNAPDRHELLDWLRRLPLLHHDAHLGFTMVHAGLPLPWDLSQAQVCAQELETILRSNDYENFLAQMFGDQPARWQNDLEGIERLRFITNAFTRMRFCYPDGSLDFAAKGPPGSQPPALEPWFALPERRSQDLRLVFGHWASLGFYRVPGIYALESGCVWGQCMTAIRLDDLRAPPVQVECS